MPTCFSRAAAPAEHSASLVILRLAEITLIEAIASEQVIVEAERNLVTKFPAAMPAFHLWFYRRRELSLLHKQQDLLPYRGLANEKNLPPGSSSAK